jgi:hypothetical protein
MYQSVAEPPFHAALASIHTPHLLVPRPITPYAPASLAPLLAPASLARSAPGRPRLPASYSHLSQLRISL